MRLSYAIIGPIMPNISSRSASSLSAVSGRIKIVVILLLQYTKDYSLQQRFLSNQHEHFSIIFGHIKRGGDNLHRASGHRFLYVEKWFFKKFIIFIFFKSPQHNFSIILTTLKGGRNNLHRASGHRYRFLYVQKWFFKKFIIFIFFKSPQHNFSIIFGHIKRGGKQFAQSLRPQEQQLGSQKWFFNFFLLFLLFFKSLNYFLLFFFFNSCPPPSRVGSIRDRLNLQTITWN